jgi:hypothetical protein
VIATNQGGETLTEPLNVLVVAYIGFLTFQQQMMFRSFMAFQKETMRRLLHIEDRLFDQ